MKKLSIVTLIILMSSIFIFSRCSQGQSDNTETTKDSTQTQTQVAALPANGGFESKVAWGKQIVAIGLCNYCHTPKKMGPAGPEADMDLAFSGASSQMPPINVNRKEFESKGLFVTNTLEWIGPWGISYAANITSDSTTGIGNWTEDQFILCLRKGKYGGVAGGRDLLPPMPWEGLRQMTDDELKAVYAYLESTKPIHNVVPQPQPPVLAMKK